MLKFQLKQGVHWLFKFELGAVAPKNIDIVSLAIMSILMSVTAFCVIHDRGKKAEIHRAT